MVAQAHTLYTWSGIIGTVLKPVEEWSFSLKTPPDSAGVVSYTAAATQLRERYATHIAPMMPPTTVLTRTRYSTHGPNGRVPLMTDGAYAQGDDITQVPGSGTLYRYPLQTALVVSLDTNRAGPTGKGRAFLPWPSFAIQDDYRISEADALTIAQGFRAFVDFLEGVNALPISVVSSKGYSSPVTAIRVGRTPDTLRSRRRDVLEGHVRVPL